MIDTLSKKLRIFGTKVGGVVVTALTRHWMGTLDYQVVYADSTVDVARDEYRGPAIYVFWHEYILFPFYLRGHCDVSMLVSQHRDADLLSEAARHMGFGLIRGSTKRGGGQALREMTRIGRRLNLTITPDGPRGPRRKLAQGPIFLSSKLGIPIIAMGFGYDRPWRLPTWDQFTIPRPGSRARCVVSPRLQVPPKINRDQLKHYQKQVEQMLNRMTTEAETWAASGKRSPDQYPLLRQPRRLWVKKGQRR